MISIGKMKLNKNWSLIRKLTGFGGRQTKIFNLIIIMEYYKCSDGGMCKGPGKGQLIEPGRMGEHIHE